MSNKFEDLNLQDVLFILKKRLVLIISVVLVCAVAGAVISSFVITPQYQAEAKLIVNNNTTNQQNMSDVYDAAQLSQQEVDTYAIVIENDTVLTNVIRDLKLGITRDQLTKKISISGIGTTAVIDLKVNDKDPAMAKNIAADIIKYAPDEIIRTVKAGSVEVVSPPDTTGSPVSPNKKLDTAVAALIGLVVSLLVAFLLEITNNTFSADEDVQKYLNFTVIGVIPNIDMKK